MQQNLIVLACCGLLTACGSGTNPFDGNGITTDAAFQDPNEFGIFSPSLLDPEGDAEVDGLNGYAYQVGENAFGTGIAAIAGVLPTTSLGDLPTTGGTVDFAGEYQLRTLSVDDYALGSVPDSIPRVRNDITLTADFDLGTLTGSSGGLAVNGRFETTSLEGEVTYGGITGSLEGFIGDEGAIGAFQGETDDAVLAGGFIVE